MKRITSFIFILEMTTYIHCKPIIVRKGVQVHQTTFYYLYNFQKSFFLTDLFVYPWEENGSYILESNSSK